MKLTPERRRVLAVLCEFGARSARQIATLCGEPWLTTSWVNGKLRGLADMGLAVPAGYDPSTRSSVWQATEAGRAEIAEAGDG